MKTINTGGVTFIELVPGGTSEWYYGNSLTHGDLYEAEELFCDGMHIEGNDLFLIHYPDGELCRPVPKKDGTYFGNPVFLDGSIYVLNVDFAQSAIQIFCFHCDSRQTELAAWLPLDSVKDCYNLQLHTEPLSLTRQGSDNMFEIIWPERVSFEMHPHESFFLRDGEKLYFNKWYEEGEGADYRYWEETVVRGLSGNITEVLPGDVMVLPDGQKWHLV